MANLFLPNLVAPGDIPGLGVYEVGHFLQHQQYLQKLAAQNILLPPYDILHMQAHNPNEFLAWLQAHETVHVFLRQHANVSGTDLSYFDPQSAESFEIWQENHRFEHGLFDLHFGTT